MAVQQRRARLRLHRCDAENIVCVMARDCACAPAAQGAFTVHNKDDLALRLGERGKVVAQGLSLVADLLAGVLEQLFHAMADLMV